MEEAVRSAVIGSVRGAACEFLEFIGYGEEMSVILRHIKEQLGQGPFKAKLQKEFFLMKQRRQKVPINLLEGWNSKLNGCKHCILLGIDQSQLKERIFQGMHPHLRDSVRFLYMKEDVGYERVPSCSL